LIVLDKNKRMSRKGNKRPLGETLPRRKRARHQINAGNDDDLAERDSCTRWLSNEVLDLVLNNPLDRHYVKPWDAWEAALVCKRWCAVVAAASVQRRSRMNQGGVLANMPALQRCTVRASWFLPLTKVPRCTVNHIQEAIHKAVGKCSLAHLLPVLLASGRAHLVRHAFLIWRETRTAHGREASLWTFYYRAWIDRFEETRYHKHQRALLDAHADHCETAIHACVMLSVVARHAQTPAILQKAITLCDSDPCAVYVALLSAAYADQVQAMGYLLVLHAKHIMREHSHNASVRQRLKQTADALWTITGARGSAACIDCLVSSFPRNNSRTRCAFLGGAWRARMCRDNFEGLDGRLQRTLDSMDDHHSVWTRSCSNHLFQAAIVADCPGVLETFLFRSDHVHRNNLFMIAARTGKKALRERLLVLFPELEGQSGCIATNQETDGPFTADGICWLAQQSWYTPEEMSVRTMIASLCIQGDLSIIGVIDAMQRIARTWPKHALKAFVGKHELIAFMIIRWAAHTTCDGNSGLDAIVGLLRHIGFFESPMGDDLWSIVMAHMDHIISARDRLIHCDACRDLPMGIVFDRLLQMHLHEPDMIVCRPRPIPIRYIICTHGVVTMIAMGLNARDQAIADRLIEHGLLIEP